MFDPAAINESVNLIDLAGRDTSLHKESGSNGSGEYAGPCPKCGGDDRFHVTATWWFCRQCHEKRGDAVEYLRWRDGLGFAEACVALGGVDTGGRTYLDKGGLSGQGDKPRASPRAAPSAEVTTKAPAAGWQDRARAFVGWAHGELMADTDALAYLLGRGLSPETIVKAKLGYNPRELYDKDLARWGISGMVAVWLPRGWVIPCEAGGILQYVKVRRRAEDLARCEAWNAAHPQTSRKKPVQKYHALQGSQKRGAVYGLDSMPGHTDLVIVEGELNALILGQALLDVAAVVSVGDAGNVPGTQALAAMATARRWYLAFDPDKAGDKGRDKLAETYRRARLLPTPWGDRGDKYDLNDAYRDGEDLAAWVIPHLGPEDPEARVTWALHHTARLDKAIIAADPALPRDLQRCWMALFEELGKVQEERERRGLIDFAPVELPRVVPNASDPEGRFLSECTMRYDGGAVPLDRLHGVYLSWCAKYGEDLVAQGDLAASLALRGYSRISYPGCGEWIGGLCLVQ